jgi:hypothetical protein
MSQSLPPPPQKITKKRRRGAQPGEDASTLDPAPGPSGSRSRLQRVAPHRAPSRLPPVETPSRNNEIVFDEV